MTVVPAIGGDVAGEIPTAAAEITHEHLASGEPAKQRRQAARQHMLLMTMHDGGSPQFVNQAQGEGIDRLPSDQPGLANDPDAQRARRGLSLGVPSLPTWSGLPSPCTAPVRKRIARRLPGHPVPGQTAPARCAQRGAASRLPVAHSSQDGGLITCSSKQRYQAGKNQAHRCS